MSSFEDVLQAKQQRIDELHRLQSDRTALLVIDMQRGFLEPGAALELASARALIPNISQLIDACRERQVPVIFTEYVYATNVPCLRGDPFGPEHLPARDGEPMGFGYPSDNCLVPKFAGQGPNSAETVPELAPRDGELVIQGFTYDKFYGTPLDLSLRSQGIQYLIMTGITADTCVCATLFSAANRDYRVTAVTDAIEAVAPDLLQAGFTIWERKFARLKTTDEVIAELQLAQ